MLEELMKGMNKENGVEMLGDQGPKAIDAIGTLVEVGLDGEVAKVKKFLTSLKDEGDLTPEELIVAERFEKNFDITVGDSKELLTVVFGKIKGWVAEGVS